MMRRSVAFVCDREWLVKLLFCRHLKATITLIIVRGPPCGFLERGGVSRGFRLVRNVRFAVSEPKSAELVCVLDGLYDPSYNQRLSLNATRV